MDTTIKLVVMCGGPSSERGISLNSARSVMDHLVGTNIEVLPLYVDQNKQFFELSKDQLYSNTPADFDFKLGSMAKKLTEDACVFFLKKADLVFPLIHGLFGEDGGVQCFLETHKIPFVGSSQKTCKRIFDKYKVSQELKKMGYPTLPSALLEKENDYKKIIKDFWNIHNLDRGVIKPVMGGSSIGVVSVNSVNEALLAAQEAFKKSSMALMIEPFCKGTEFTVCVLHNHKLEPVPLIPTQIKTSYEHNQIFSYRRKYLPSDLVRFFCPPKIPLVDLMNILTGSRSLSISFLTSDIVRFDCWFSISGDCLYTDFNVMSGMEQNSFIFQQAAFLGLSHTELLLYILKNALIRYGNKKNVVQLDKKVDWVKKRVSVLFGGATAERQVSLMSGTNVWLKLRHSLRYEPEPYLWAPDGSVWYLPYSFALHHTVEEILDRCKEEEGGFSHEIIELIVDIRKKLGLSDLFLQEGPRKMSLDAFLDMNKKQDAFVFLALHGGKGENGWLQEKLDEKGLLYNGSGVDGSRIGMDKGLTAKVINQAGIQGVKGIPQISVYVGDYLGCEKEGFERFWSVWIGELGSDHLLIKPACDGCSAGVMGLKSAWDFERYVGYMHRGESNIPAGIFEGQGELVELPKDKEQCFILQPFIKVDKIQVEGDCLVHISDKGWIELTVGVLESRGRYKAFHPSMTIAQNQVLSLEEKFQGGTGVNITPPPENIISKADLEWIKQSIEKVAEVVCVKNYCRIDCFFNRIHKTMWVIEVNTLPALTPSTVLYHQALAEEEKVFPTQFLEGLIDGAIGNRD